MGFGIKVSKSEYDVRTATVSQLTFSSEYNSLKIWKEGSGIADGSGDALIAHGLNFTPAFLVYFELVSGRSYSVGGDNASVYGSPVAYSNLTNLILDTSASVPYYYFIFGDTLNQTGTSTLITSQGFGIKISKIDKEVTSQYIEDIITTTTYSPMKIYEQGLFDLDCSFIGKIQTINHSLPFRPAFLVWGKKSTESKYSLLPLYQVDGRNSRCYSTTTQLVIEAYPGLDTGTYNFKYLIFAERAI